MLNVASYYTYDGTALPAKFSALNGQRITKVESAPGGEGLHPGAEIVEITTADGNVYHMVHDQDCCESVDLHDVIGDWHDLIDATVIDANEATNSETHPEGYEAPYGHDSFTWTFYTIQTNKGAVTLRWFGESNGYYSEDVSFYLVAGPALDAFRKSKTN